jgi:hypothetical protein
MGRRNFHGKIVTIADAVEADYLVIVKCGRCETDKQMHPYNLVSGDRGKRLLNAPLDTELSGFFCKRCRRSVNATIRCTYRHPGEM